MGKKVVYATTSGSPDRVLGLGELAVAGALSALPMAAVAAPVERVKVVLQVGSVVSILSPAVATLKTAVWQAGDLLTRSLFSSSPHLSRSTDKDQTRSTKAPSTSSPNSTRKVVSRVCSEAH